MNMKKIIGSRITQARKANGLTIKLLAERTGLGAARIGNWEQGTRSPGPEEVIILSKTLRVAASWLLCFTNDPRGEWFDDKEIL
ncbi:TPA: helix-turn-helix domain-containing protein [Legionella pneumophila subsp. pneumophila]|nr:helix-turn-helix domain-containing protein [Legionella pneumophila subsp. pneumophila]HAT9453316.1 helix-turn-helix domain-containing protein [Legionella pneumophila subsp. pneumophila]HAT9456572.1 helix-turn-helix domain-containing protein [Legionella pneumophila subsp. pneumophila]HAT9465844.1 helix-turn-helix domain-containing protein [Legionella pneumophila subsp. pneumophila]